MKKARCWVFFTGLLLVAALTVAGCGQKETQKAPNPAQEAPKTPASEQKKVDKLLMQASSMGGIGYGYAIGLSKVSAKVIPNVNFTVEATAGYVENAKRLAQKVGDLGVVSQNDAYSVFKKEGEFSDAKVRLLTMLPVHTLDWHVIVPADGPVKSIWDLKGKKVSLQPKGSFNERLSASILDALAIQCNRVYLPHAEAAEQMVAKSLDAHIASGSSPAFSELAVRMPLRVISLTDDDAKAIQAKLPYLNRTSFKAESYYKKTGEATTVNVWAIIACRDDLPEDIVYSLVKGAYENKDLMLEGHASAKYMEPSQVSNLSVPLHPGAYKYFKESKVAIPDTLIPPK